MKILLIFLYLLLITPLFGQQELVIPDLSKVQDTSFWHAYNRQVIFDSCVFLNSNEGDGMLWYKNLNFANGSIELDIKGKNEQGRSFVGLAFHGVNDSIYDAIYFRPFNFQNANRNKHSIQYISQPEFSWYNLRENFPGKFENDIAPAPNPEDWFHVKIDVEFPKVTVYVNNAKKPSLTVTQLSDQKKGMLGFWVGNNAEGCFKNLKIINRPDAFSSTQKQISLTSEQKKADIEFFFEFVRENYPFIEFVTNDKKLPNILSFENEFIRKAGKTKNNKEFIDLFAELIQLLEQGTIHADILEGVDLPVNFDTAKHALYNDLSIESFKLNNYWWNLLDIQKKFSNTGLKLKYHQGKYIITDDYKNNDCDVAKGSVITEIDGYDTHEYVKKLQNKIWLRLDDSLNIPYSFHPSPFTTFGDKSKQYWNVGFINGSGDYFECQITKKQGFRDAGFYPSSMDNVICRELTQEIAYIRLFRFPPVSQAVSDLEIIHDFFNREHTFSKVIIDVRNNPGGSKTYGEELLFKPFLKDTAILTEYACVKKSTYNKLSSLRKTISEMEGDNFDIQHNFGQIEKITFEKLPDYIKNKNSKDTSNYYFKTTTTYYPENTVNFSGDIILLTDNDCGSACDCLTRTFKLTSTAKTLGTNTCGGTASVLPCWIFELPNSHICFNLEVDMNFNLDGTINEIYGTKPDINLEPSTYPTSFPKSFKVDDLLNDDWIKWVIYNDL